MKCYLYGRIWDNASFPDPDHRLDSLKDSLMMMA